MNKSCYHTLMLSSLKHSSNISVRCASGGHLYSIGLVTCTFHLGKQTFTYNFIVCKNLARPFILCLNFLGEHKIGLQWLDLGGAILTHDKHILVGSNEAYPGGPKRSTRSQIKLLPRTYTILNVKTVKTNTNKEYLYDIQFNDLLEEEHPNLMCIPELHKTSSDTTTNILLIAVYILMEDIHLIKGRNTLFLRTNKCQFQ